MSGDACVIVESQGALSDAVMDNMSTYSFAEDSAVFNDSARQVFFTTAESSGHAVASLDGGARYGIVADEGELADVVANHLRVADVVYADVRARDHARSITYEAVLVAQGIATAIAVSHAPVEMARDYGEIAESWRHTIRHAPIVEVLHAVDDVLREQLVDVAADVATADGGSVADLRVAVDVAVSVAAAHDVIAPAVTTLSIVEDECKTIDAIVGGGVMRSLADDEVWTYDAAGDIGPGAVTSWWTARLDTMAMSRYVTPHVATLASVGDDIVVAGLHVYWMRGNSDDGQEIDARLVCGLDDLRHAGRNRDDSIDPNALKRLDHGYIGYESDGTIALQVGETRGGVERTHDYLVPARRADAMTHGRVRIGRGLRSRYFRFTIMNVDGSRVTLDGMTIDVIQTTRRV